MVFFLGRSLVGRWHNVTFLLFILPVVFALASSTPRFPSPDDDAVGRISSSPVVVAPINLSESSVCGCRAGGVVRWSSGIGNQLVAATEIPSEPLLLIK